MQELQKSVSRIINKKAGRINHVFGGPYKAALITTESYYYNVYKYVYRNPLQAGLTGDIMKYKYSSLHGLKGINLIPPSNGIDVLVPYNTQLDWLNEVFEEDHYNAIKKGLTKTKFKYM